MTGCADPHPSGTLQCHLLRGQRSSLAMAQNIFETLLELIFFFFCPILGISLNVAQEATVRAGEHRSKDEGHRRTVAIKAASPSPL